MKKYTIQNQSCLLNPVTNAPITGSRIYDGDFVLGEWYDTGNEEAAPKIIQALNDYQSLLSIADRMAYELCKSTAGHPLNCQCEWDKMLRDYKEHKTT